jgi:hypothetical protein
MGTVSIWPSEPPGLAGLADAVGERLGEPVEVVEDPRVSAGLVVIVTGVGDVGPAIDSGASPLVFVIGDGYLGTDVDDLSGGLGGAAAVAAARSLAVRRESHRRANVVCIPERFLGPSGELRGPLAHDIGVGDLADAVAFLMSDDAGYVDGQVLFVDGGRHLFSSMTA